MNLRISSLLSFLLLGSSLQAATLTLTTKYGATGGLAGDFNQVGNVVNGRNICPAVNDNSNSTPGCDMSGDAGYNNNGTDKPDDDYYTGDLVVRTNDGFELGASYSWTGEKGEDEITIKGTLPSVTGFIWDGIPGSCDAKLSSLSADRKVISCVRKGADSINGNNVGSYSETMWFAVKVEGDAPNGSKPGDIVIELSEKTGTAGTLTDGVLDGNDANRIVITSSPRWNIDGYGGPGYYTTTYGAKDDKGDRGWYLWYNFTIEVDEVYKEKDDPINPSLGNEALKGAKDATVTFTADLSTISPNAKLVTWDESNSYFKGGKACSMDNYTNSDEPYPVFNSTYPDRSILTPAKTMEVSCTPNGQTVNIEVQHIDGTLTDAPIKNRNGGLLPVNRKIAAIGVMRVFVPLSDVEAGADGTKGTDDDGQLTTRNCYDNFNPLGISDTQNFNGEQESKNDNCYNITLYASRGSWRKDYRKGWSDQADQRELWNKKGETIGWSAPPTDAAIVQGGDGTVTPDGRWGTYTIYQNTGGIDIDNPMICDVIDTNTYMMELLDSTKDNTGTFVDDRIHAVDLNYGPTETVPGLKLEYAVGYIGDWPPNPDTSPEYAVAKECNATSIQWYPDFVEASKHGAVSKVRVSAPTLPVQKYIAMRIKHKARANYLSSGDPIPNKTLLVNYATYKSALTGDRYIKTGYMPHNADTNHEGGASGDRLIMQRAKVRILKEMYPMAVSPGSEPIVTLSPSFTNDSINSESEDVKIVDVLPNGLSYKNGSTVGTYDNGVEYGEPEILEATDENCNKYASAIVAQKHPCGTLNGGTGKESILLWDLGIQETGTVFKDLNFTTVVTIDSPKGVLANYAQVESPADDSVASKRLDNANVNNSVPSALLIVKSVQTPLHEINKGKDLNWMEFRVGLRNGSSSDLSDLDVIDILPFNGDGVEGSFRFTPQDGTTIDRDREPPTSYNGDFKFDSVLFDDNGGACDATNIEYWFTKASNPLDISPKSTSNTKADGTPEAIWCKGDTAGVDAGCGFTNDEITAVRARGVAVPGSATCFLNLKFATNNNMDGDVYSNTAGASAKDNTGTYLDGVLSNTVSARVYASSIGDTVWYDKNRDGIQDDNEIGVDGITVNLYQEGKIVATTKTSNGGKYSFKNLIHGDYIVEVIAGDGYMITTTKSGGNSAVDSDINSDGKTDTITLGEDEKNLNIDAGLTTPIISGTVFDDGNGDGNINGKPISTVDNKGLFVNLIDKDGKVLAVKKLVSGQYLFDGLDGIRANSSFKVILSSTEGVVGEKAPKAELPVEWNNADGENINSQGAGNDGDKDGVISVSVEKKDVLEVDFGINRKPVSSNVIAPSQLNPGDEIQVDVPKLIVTDTEDGTPKTITIKSLPNNAKLYYDGTEITTTQIIKDFDSSKLKIDPADGVLTASFTYTSTDTVGVESNEATVTMPFTGLSISGNLFADGNGDNIINGTKIGSVDGKTVSVTLLDASNKPLATKEIKADGSYLFDSSDGIEPNKSYSVVLSQVANATTSTLPTDWNHADGEHVGLDKGTDGTADGIVSVKVIEVDVPQVNFGINKRPIAVDKAVAPTLNPGGDKRVTLPALPITDNEDKVPTTITIKTLATNGTLYYNGVAVTEGQVINNYDATLLSVDPISGEPTVEFTYSTTDRVGVESTIAKVTYPFTGISISGNLFADGSGDNTINGTKIDKPSGETIYVMLLDNKDNLIASTSIDKSGAYSFTASSGDIEPNTNYSVVISTVKDATTSTLPQDWNHADGEHIGLDKGTDGNADGKIAVAVQEVSLPEINFGINHKPVAVDQNETVVLNPGGETKVVVPTLSITDIEDGTPPTLTIKSLATNGVLYYNGVAVTNNQVISNFDNSKLTVDPVDGETTVSFTYSTTDRAGVESNIAKVVMPFRGLKISGNLFVDGNGDGNISGTIISAPDGVQLYVTLLGCSSPVMASKQGINSRIQKQTCSKFLSQAIIENGAYSFDGNDSISANTNYNLLLTTEINGTTAKLPTNWNNADGENINSINPMGNDGKADGEIFVSVATNNIPLIDFGINHRPVAEDNSNGRIVNPGGAVQVQVPDLVITDDEDNRTKIVTIVTLPTAGTLYYNGVAIDTNQTVINDFNNSRLTVDPDNGDVVVSFTYTTTDITGFESEIATVQMPFYVPAPRTYGGDGSSTPREEPREEPKVNTPPVAENVETPLVDNPGGDVRVPVGLSIRDEEDGIPTTVTIQTLPDAGVLYYNGQEVVAGQVITDFDNSLLTIDPKNGSQSIVFQYTTTDSDGLVSDLARVRIPFSAVGAEDDFNIGDDSVLANEEGAVTTLYVLENDTVGEGSTIRLVNIEEGEILWNNGMAVGGTNITTMNELYVDGEGTWRVHDDGTVTFTADDGFEGVPTPVYYIVLDEHGNQSNVAELRITSPCTCETYESKSSDSVSALGNSGMVLMILIQMLTFLFLFRKEELEVK
jgi:hypothetical protein